VPRADASDSAERSLHGMRSLQSPAMTRVMLAFRVLVTAVVAGADFLIPWHPSPLAWLTVGAIAATLISLVVRRPLRMVAVEAWLVPVVLLIGGLVDTRAHVVPVPNPLDGYALGTASVVGAVWGWSAASRLVAAGVAVQAAFAVAEAGVGVEALVVLSQRATWLVAAAAVTTFIGSRTAAAGAAEAAEAEGRERLTQLRALHDRAVQTLTAVVVGAPGDWSRIRSDAAAERDRLVALDSLASGAVGVIDAVHGVVRRRRGNQRIRLDTRGVPVAPDAVTAAIAAAVEEALTNVAKHAPGASAAVEVRGAPGRVDVQIGDDGPGWTGRAAPGFGITQSLCGRMAAVGGSATVSSASGDGTTVTLSWRAPADHRRRWAGAAGAMPRRARVCIIVATVGWHLVSGLSVLFVAWHHGWVQRPGAALAGLVLPAVLLLAGLVVDRHRRVADLVRPAVLPVLVLLGPVLLAAGAVFVEPLHLARDYADPLTVSGATLTAAATFFGGARVGAVALGLNALTIAVIAPALNGYAVAAALNVTTVERLVITFVGWYLFVRIGPLLAEAVATQRRTAVLHARIAESAVLGKRLVPVLSAIADAPCWGEAVRQQAFVALGWARVRLTGTARGGGEGLADALAAVAARHPTVVRPPRIVHVARPATPDAVARLAGGLDAALDALAADGTGPLTVTATGADDVVRVTLSSDSGPPPGAAAVVDALDALGECGAVEALTLGGTGWAVVLSVPVGAPAVPPRPTLVAG
jgi:signal transduction histidine kinase